ncbi:hypothetical protein [Rhodococcus qingshengii]|uniref:hypothetical protein n=1 Tax=Rhodococcus qingshengii TaxID=334542 RepID=UPI001F1FD1EB|nr:hypothetical protein [Rhodococcus qingshengii]
MNRSRSIAVSTVTCEVESAYPERVDLEKTAAPVDFIRERIEGVARFESGTHRTS